MIIGLLGRKGVGKDTAGAVLAKELNGTCIALADPIKRFFLNAFGLTENQLWGDAKEKPVTAKQYKALRRFLPYTDGSGSPFTRLPKRWKDKYARAVKTLLADAFTEANCQPPPEAKRYGDSNLEGAIRVWLRDAVWKRQRKKVTPRWLLQQFGTEFVRVHLGHDYWLRVARPITQKVLDGWAYDKAQGLAKRHGGSDAVILTDVRFRNEILAVKGWGGKVYRIVRDQPGAQKTEHASESEQDSIPNWWCDGVINNRSTKEGFEEAVRELAIVKVKKLMLFKDPRFRRAS